MSKNAFNLLIVPAVILIVRAFAAHLGIFNSFLLPPPEQVLESFGQLIKDGTLGNPYFGEFHEIFLAVSASQL